MKKAVVILLTLAMLFLVACGETTQPNNDKGNISPLNDKQPDNSSPTDGTEPTQGTEPAAPTTPEDSTTEEQPPAPPQATASLLDAAEKLQGADSYTMTYSTLQKASDYLETTEVYQVSKPDSKISYARILHDAVQILGYYEDTVGYINIYNDKREAVDKVFSDQPFTPASVTPDGQEFPIPWEETTALSLFDTMSPTQTTEADGSITLIAAVPASQWLPLYTALTGKVATENELGAVTGLSATGKISKDGFLTEFGILANFTIDNLECCLNLNFRIENINSTTVETPDFAQDYVPTDDSIITFLSDGTAAQYSCILNYYNDRPVYEMIFRGFYADNPDGYTVETYTVLSQVEGIPVVFLDNVVLYGSVTVERLVIPSGIHVDICGTYDENGFTSGAEETTLFFEAPKGQVDKTFFVESEDIPAGTENPVCVKAAYYANQWLITNGIPTPL